VSSLVDQALTAVTA